MMCHQYIVLEKCYDDDWVVWDTIAFCVVSIYATRRKAVKAAKKLNS